MTGNDFVAFLLRTPLYFFMGDTLLITVTGRKTGKTYSTPVNFYREGDLLWIMTSRDRSWWRNVKGGAEVALVLKGKTIQAFAEAVLDETAVESHLCDYVCAMPFVAKSLGIRTTTNVPNPEDIRRVAKDRLFVKIKPTV